MNESFLQTGGLISTWIHTFLHKISSGQRHQFSHPQQHNLRNILFISKCKQFILYQEKVILLPHSLKVKEKEKQFYIRKRYKLEKKKKNKKTQKLQQRECVQLCRSPLQSIPGQSSSYKNHTINVEVLLLTCKRPDSFVNVSHSLTLVNQNTYSDEHATTFPLFG